MKDQDDSARVVVLGAGYAGLTAALRLAPHHRVTLVDPDDRFTERIRLHELSAGRPSVTHPLSGLLRGTGIIPVTARATDIDTDARVVRTDDGRALPYTRLVYALGSGTDTRGGVLGTGSRAYTTETAEALRKRLLDGSGSLAVVGGGLTGIELSAELAESYPDWRVQLITAGEVGAGLSGKGRSHVRAALDTRGVRRHEGHRVGDADGVDADVVVWAAAMTATTGLAARAGLALDETGRVLVDPVLRSRTHPEVYAAGDAAAAPARGGQVLRMACATALPTGAQVAAAITAELCGDQPRPLRFGYLLQCISLGRRDGLVQLVRSDDSPRDRILTGRPAAWVKEQIVRSTVGFLGLARRHPGVHRLIPGIG